MLTQEVDCHKCGCSNKLGTIYCRNCGKKLKFDKRMLNSQKSQKVKKIFKRAVKAIFVIAILSVIGMAFCPWGFPGVQKITDKEEISAVITTCQEIDDSLAKQTSKASYEFTPAEATLAANYLATEHEKKQAGQQQAAISFSSAPLGGKSNMGSSKQLGGTGSMKFEEKTAPAAPAYVDPDLEQRRAWMKRKQEARNNPGKKTVLSPNFDFIITIKDDKTLCIVLKDTWMKFIPARLEIWIVPQLKINAEEKTQVLEYKLSAAYLGYLPIPLYLNDHILALFEEMMMQERKWAKQYLKQIKNVEIVNGNINVTFAK